MFRLNIDNKLNNIGYKDIIIFVLETANTLKTILWAEMEK